MQLMLSSNLIAVGISWIPVTDFSIILDAASKSAIEFHMKDMKEAGTIVQGGYTINWKKLS